VKVSEQWLREWLSLEGDTDAIADQLTMAGLEVDAVEPASAPLDGVVAGRVVAHGTHPDADRLSLCQVDIGAGEPVQIVCGASNVAEGGVYPVATAGTRLPGGLKIKRGKLRGQVSEGMLCSSAELALAETADGLLELAADTLPGAPVTEVLQLDDQIIDIDLTPNRADCFSMLGVARDLAAINGVAFEEPDVAAVPAASDAALSVELQAERACPVFASRVVTGLDPQATTPLWMSERLRRAGIKPLYPAVDVTNYVLIELGQPLHAYDRRCLRGALAVRWAQPGETLQLITEQELQLDPEVLVVADAAGAVALAGIMGGADSAISATTTEIVLESAFFAPEAIAGRARRFGLHTDAALRFERGVDFSGQVRAIERATELLLEVAGGVPGPVELAEVPAELPARSAVGLRRERLARVLGIDLPDAEVKELLTRLGFEVATETDGWRITPTAARFDIEIEEDLIEEVARLHGYAAIPSTRQPVAAQPSAETETRLSSWQLRRTLASRGYLEAVTYSFVDRDAQNAWIGEASETELANPLAADMAVMRRSLWPGLLALCDANRKRQQARVRVFELGVIFSSQNNEIIEKKSLGGLVWGARLPEHWDSSADSGTVDLFDVKADLEALAAQSGLEQRLNYVKATHPLLRPGRTARVQRGDTQLGWLGELHPRFTRELGLSDAPVLFELDAESLLVAQTPQYRTVSRFPSVRRDLAVVVADDVPAADLLDTARQTAGDVLQQVFVFDVYTGGGIEKGLKSVALGLILQETSSTLTERNIDRIVRSVIAEFSTKFNASIRE